MARKLSPAPGTTGSVPGSTASPAKKRSAIEYTIMGIAWKRGPCTTYALMKELSNSVSTYYKSRAGTAYPVVERLVSLGLLMYSDNSGLKGERLVTISPDGIAALDEWLKPPVPMEEVAHTVDFLRLRAFYLGATTAEAREAFFQDAIEGLNLHIANLDAAILEYQKMGDLFSELALTGTIFEARARIEWLESIRERALAAPQARPPKQLQSLQ